MLIRNRNSSSNRNNSSRNSHNKTRNSSNRSNSNNSSSNNNNNSVAPRQVAAVASTLRHDSSIRRVTSVLGKTARVKEAVLLVGSAFGEAAKGNNKEKRGFHSLAFSVFHVSMYSLCMRVPIV